MASIAQIQRQADRRATLRAADPTLTAQQINAILDREVERNPGQIQPPGLVFRVVCWALVALFLAGSIGQLFVAPFFGVVIGVD